MIAKPRERIQISHCGATASNTEAVVVPTDFVKDGYPVFGQMRSSVKTLAKRRECRLLYPGLLYTQQAWARSRQDNGPIADVPYDFGVMDEPSWHIMIGVECAQKRDDAFSGPSGACSIVVFSLIGLMCMTERQYCHHQCCSALSPAARSVPTAVAQHRGGGQHRGSP